MPCKTILKLAYDRKLYIILRGAFYLCYVCVLIDITRIHYQPKTDKDPLDRGLYNDIIYCNDSLLLFDVILAVYIKAHGDKNARSSLILMLEVISLVPYELIYQVLGGNNYRLYYNFRLRYIIRIIRYIPSLWEKSHFTLSLFRLMVQYIFFLSFICLTVTCLKLGLFCMMEDQTKLELIECSNLGLYEFALTYFLINGQITSADLAISGTSYAKVGIYLGLFQLTIFAFLFFLYANIICTRIEILTAKYEFACVCDLAFWHLSLVKKVGKKTWTVLDEMYEEFFKAYLNSYWPHWNIVATRSNVHGFKIATVPDIMTTEIALDMSWNMFKHSQLFRKVEVHYLRQLAPYVKYKTVMSGEKLCQVGIIKSQMIYIISGVINIYSEANAETSIISFRGGTCLGEISLLLGVPAMTTITCETHCEILSLNRSNFTRVTMKFYPEIFTVLKQVVADRLRAARKYDKLGKKLFELGKQPEKSRYSLRYIKYIQRKYLLGKKTSVINFMHDLNESQVLENGIYCPTYIDMYNMSENENKIKCHFVATGINLKLDPDSTLLVLWNFLIYMVIMLTSIVYPLGAMMSSSDAISLPFQFYMNIVTLIYFLDFLSFAIIAKRTRTGWDLDLDNIFTAESDTVDFYINLISALPIDTIYSSLSPASNNAKRFLQINRLLKSYKLIKFVENKFFFKTKYLLILSLCRTFYSQIVLIFFAYYIFNLCGYMDMYITTIIHASDFVEHITFVYQFIFSTALMEVVPDRSTLFVPLILLQYVIFIYKTKTLSDIISSFTLHYSHGTEFENFVDDVRRTFVLYNFEPQIRKRIDKYLNMHFVRGQGIFMLKMAPMMEILGKSIYSTQKDKLYRELLEDNGLFKHLNNEQLREIAQTVHVLFIPKGEFVVYAGACVSEFYIIAEGLCGRIGSVSRILRKLTVGDALLQYEMLCGANSVYNIMALTDCKLLRIEQHVLLRVFILFSDIYNMVNESLDMVQARKDLKLLQSREYNSSLEPEKRTKSLYVFRKDAAFFGAFGKFRALRLILFNYTITPYGKFWFYWEIVHVSLVYIVAFLISIPFTHSSHIWSGWFWIFALFDVMFLSDIYLRFHVIFFNAYNVEVRHPFKTATNYLSGAFIIDIFSLLPIVLCANVGDGILYYKLVLYRMNGCLQLYRFFGLRDYLFKLHMSQLRFLHLFFYFLFVMLVANFSLSLLIHSNCRIYFQKELMICPYVNNTEVEFMYWNHYYYSLHMFLHNFFLKGLMYTRKFDIHIWKFFVIEMMGFYMMSICIGIFVGLGLFRNGYLTTFQIRMQRMVKFIQMGRIDKKLRFEIIKHYEQLWVLREGKPLRVLFNNLSKSCYEELMYFQFGGVLHNSVIFRAFPSSVVKDFLCHPAISCDFFLIRGIIIKVNDVQNRIYIVCRGAVDVLAPDLGKLQTLQEGSVFGCLDNILLQRSTLSYVAKVHCELISINNKYFYELLRRYPTVLKNYIFLLKSTNFDFIKSDVKPTLYHMKTVRTRISERESKISIESVSTYYSAKLSIKRWVLRLRVYKPNEKVELFFIIASFLAFLIECYQKITLHIAIGISIICYLCDLLFWLKMYLEFSTAFEDANGLLVTNRKRIAVRYVKESRRFIFDFLNNFPFELVAYFFFIRQNIIWSACRSLRILKIINVYRYMEHLRNKLNINVQLIRGIYIVLVALTMQQLSMIYLSKDLLLKKRAKNNYELYMYSLITQTYYMSGALYTPSTETHPLISTKFYNIGGCILLILTTFVVLYIFAELVSSYQVFSYGSYSFQCYLNTYNIDMKKKEVSRPLRERIVNYYTQLLFKGRNVQFPSFIRDAPYYLREGVLFSMFGYHLENHDVFKLCHSDLIRQMVASFETLYFFPGDYIAFEGDIDSKMYFIHEGEVVGLIADTLHYETADITLKTGDSFGFDQLLHKNVGHEYTYKVTSDSTILVLKQEIVLNLLKFFPASKHIIFTSRFKENKKISRPILADIAEKFLSDLPN